MKCLSGWLELKAEGGRGAALSYYSAEEAKTTLIDFIRDNPAVDIAVIVVIIALLTVIVTQQKNIRARKEVEESHHQVDALNKRVFVDALTSVRNKGSFNDYIQSLQERLDKKEPVAFAVIILDCDNLKTVNDQYGHDKGDVYIKSCRITATKGSLAKLAITFETSGPLMDAQGWDFINGTLFTYSNFANGTLTVDGTVTNGTLQHNTPS